MTYENIKSTTQDRVGIVTLDRPDALNALSNDLMRELADALTEFETNDEIGAYHHHWKLQGICCWGRYQGHG